MDQITVNSRANERWRVVSEFYTMIYSIGVMGLVNLPTFTTNINQMQVTIHKYTIHRSYAFLFVHICSVCMSVVSPVCWCCWWIIIKTHSFWHMWSKIHTLHITYHPRIVYLHWLIFMGHVEVNTDTIHGCYVYSMDLSSSWSYSLHKSHLTVPTTTEWSDMLWSPPSTSRENILGGSSQLSSF